MIETVSELKMQKQDLVDKLEEKENEIKQLKMHND